MIDCVTYVQVTIMTRIQCRIQTTYSRGPTFSRFNSLHKRSNRDVHVLVIEWGGHVKKTIKNRSHSRDLRGYFLWDAAPNDVQMINIGLETIRTPFGATSQKASPLRSLEWLRSHSFTRTWTSLL